MSKETLRQLGWEAHRVRILLRISDWEWLRDRGLSMNVETASFINEYVQRRVWELRDQERVYLTPESERASNGSAADPDTLIFGREGAEW